MIVRINLIYCEAISAGNGFEYFDPISLNSLRQQKVTINKIKV